MARTATPFFFAKSITAGIPKLKTIGATALLPNTLIILVATFSNSGLAYH